jgi:hypothetical protein
MSSNRARRNGALLQAALSCTLAGALLACDDKQTREPLPDWSAGYDIAAPDAGLDYDARRGGVPAGGFGIVIPDDVKYPHRLYEEGTNDAPCAVTLGDQLHKDIRCMFDMNELDLNVLGFKFDIIAPVGGCDFVLYSPYIYDSWEIGTGPTEVSYTLEADGSFSDEINSENGEPVCKFDHSREYVDGPNCCTGPYTLTVKSAETGKSTPVHAVWGGPSADCYDGAAFLRDGAQFDRFGFPLDPIYYIDREHHVIPIVEQGISDKYPDTNVPLANYWNPQDGEPPAGLSSDRARRDYTLICYDDAAEMLARIRFQMREWNEEVEFDTRGNPDTVGQEIEFDQGPINDILDWKDQGVDYTMTLRPK